MKISLFALKNCPNHWFIKTPKINKNNKINNLNNLMWQTRINYVIMTYKEGGSVNFGSLEC
jgi:hypothetical protein